MKETGEFNAANQLRLALGNREMRIKDDGKREARRQLRFERAKEKRWQLATENLEHSTVPELVKLCGYIGIPLVSKKRANVIATIEAFKKYHM